MRTKKTETAFQLLSGSQTAKVPAIQLLDEAQTSKLLYVSRAALRHWRATGQGPPWARLGARLVRYELAALREWISQSAEKVQR